MRLLFIIVALALIIASSGLAGGYKITDVIEVGSAAWHPFVGPLRWSPDGTMLAFFANNYLMISDTLGNSRPVVALDMVPQRCEWVSESDLAIMLRQSWTTDSMYYRLILVNANTGEAELLIDSYRTKTSKRVAGNQFFDGPYLTLSGDAYYELTNYTGFRSNPKNQSRVWILPEKAPLMRNSYILRCANDGVYKVRLDGSDSTLVAEKVISHTYTQTAAASDLSWVLNGPYLMSGSGLPPIWLDTIPHKIPDGSAGCGVMYPSFSPDHTEILFQFSCDDGHTITGDMVASFDYSTYELTVLDDLIELESCMTPVYSNTGHRLALRSGGRVYIILREDS